MGDVLVGSQVFVMAAFLFLCVRVPSATLSGIGGGAGTTIHTWVDVELRVVGKHVAVNIKNPNLSWVHNLGPQQKSTFLPWTGVLNGLCWVIWPELRCWGYRNNLVWLDSPRLVAKPCERGFLCARIEWCFTMRWIPSRSLGTLAGVLIVIGRVAVESPGIVVEAQLGRALPCPPALLGEEASESGPKVFGEV